MDRKEIPCYSYSLSGCGVAGVNFSTGGTGKCSEQLRKLEIVKY